MNQNKKQPLAKMSDFMKSDEAKKLQDIANKPALTSKSEQAAPEEKKAPTNYVETIYLRKLKDEIGPSEVAERIGCSPNYVSTTTKDGKVAMPYELAAKQIWLENFEPKPEPVTITAPRNSRDIFIRCPNEKLGVLHTILTNVGIDAVMLPDEL